MPPPLGDIGGRFLINTIDGSYRGGDKKNNAEKNILTKWHEDTNIHLDQKTLTFDNF
jgi:hypothetical protein